MKNINNFLIKEEKTIKIIMPFLLLFLLLIYQYIPIIILHSLGIKFTKWTQTNKVIYLFIINILFIIFLAFIYKKDLKNNLKDLKKNFTKIIKISILYWLIGVVIMMTSNYIINLIKGSGLPENEESVRQLIEKAPLFMFFQVMIYAPFTEEIIFRKSIKNAINNKYIFILVSGLVFGGMHIISGFSDISDLLYIIPYGAFGCTLATVYNKTNNIFSSILIHSFHNTSTYILLLILKLIK